MSTKQQRLIWLPVIAAAILGFITLQAGGAKTDPTALSANGVTASKNIDVGATREFTRAIGQGSSASRNSAIVFTLRPTGFEPSEVTIPRGRYLLAVENRTGLEEVNLQLHQQAGQKLIEVRLRRGKSVWKSVVDLPPGRFVITETGHSDWACYINITS